MPTTKRTAKALTPKAKKLVWGKRIALATLGVFALNSLTVAAGTPWVNDVVTPTAADQAVIDGWLEDHPGAGLTIAENISPSSLVQLPSTGTVSIVGDDIIYIAPPENHGNWGLRYILSHEHHHVQQINLAEAQTGLTPDIWNPIATASHYGSLGALALELNRAYGQPWYSRDGIEISADCYAAWVEGETVGYEGQAAYTHITECTPVQVAASLAVSEGVWPSTENIEARLAEAETLLQRRTKEAPDSAKKKPLLQEDPASTSTE